MADKIVKGIMTVDGIAAVDYESLANLPTIDAMPTVNSRNAVQSGGVYTALEGKLDSQDGKAADSILFGGQSPEYYATAEKLQDLEEALGINAEGDSIISTTIKDMQEDISNKLDKTAQAVDSDKLDGHDSSYFATATAVNDAQITANNAIDMGISSYAHEKSGTVHNLIGPADSSTYAGRNIKFTSRADWEPGDTLTINGEECACYDILKNPLEDTIIFANDVVVTATLSWMTVGKRWACFFKLGSGVANNLATLPSDNISLLQQGAGSTTIYKTVAEITADKERLDKIMNDGNALDYFCRSQELKNEFFEDDNFINYLEKYHKKMSVSTWNAGKDLITPITFSASDGITYVDGSFCYTNNCSHNSGTLIGESESLGGYIEYNLNGSQIVPWKFIFESSYVAPNGQNITIQGLMPEGSWVDISDTIDLPRNKMADSTATVPTATTKTFYCTKTVKCTAVRVVFNMASSIYPKGCRFYYL